MKKLTPSLILLLMAAPLPMWGAAPDLPSATNAAAAPKPAAKPAGLFDDKLVAKGKGVEVNRSQLDEEVIRFKAQVAGRNQTVPPEQMALMERQLLDQLIQVQLLKAKATEADK